MRQIKIKQILLAPSVHALESAEIKAGVFSCTGATERWEILPGTNDEKHLLAAAKWELDGVIGSVVSRKVAEAFAKRKIPVVTIHAASAHHSMQLVCSDYKKEGRMAADFLAAKNHRHFAFFGSYSETPFLRAHSILRGIAFINQLNKIGFDVYTFPNPIEKQLQPGIPQKVIYRQIIEWLDKLPRPTAIFCSDDSRARYLANLCRQQGVRIPEELSVLGAGNIATYCICNPPRLSSVATNHHLVGFKAAQALARLIKHPVARPKPIIVPPVQVVERDSTGEVETCDASLHKAIAFIREHACEKLTVKELAHVANLSPRVLQKRFPQTTGRTLFEEIRRRRLERVKEFLIHTDYSLKEIAQQCGFNDSFYLSRAFREKEGIPPREFRRQRLRR